MCTAAAASAVVLPVLPLLPVASAQAAGDGWSSWYAIGGPLSGGTDAASWRPGHVDVFARGADGRLHHRGWPTSSGGWSAYDDLGPIASDPAAVSMTDGRLDILARGRRGLVGQLTYVRGSGWRSWRALPGGTIVGSPDIASWGNGRLDAVARGRDGTLLHQAYDPSRGWSGWRSIGGTLTSDPSVVSWGPGRLDVFARGAAGNLQHRAYTLSSGWSSWGSEGGYLGSAPDVASWGSGRLDIFAKGRTNTLWQKSWDRAFGWSSWQRIPASINAAPGAVSWGAGRIDVFVSGTNNKLYHKAYDGGGVRSNIVALAQTKVGIGETPAGSNCTPFEPSGTCLPWCTYFATWVWHNASTSLPYYSYSGTVVQWAAGNGRWKPGPYHPAPGDIVVYGTSATSTVHSGIVEHVYSDGTITTIEGNSSDRVSHQSAFDPAHATSAGRPAPVLGYASPLASSASAPTFARYSPPAPTLQQILSQDGGH